MPIKSPEIMINNNYIYDNYWGIDYSYSPDIQITNNTFVNNYYGTRGEENSTRGMIKLNKYTNNRVAINLENAPNSQIVHNIIKSSLGGIYIDSSYPEGASKYCNISYNLIENSTKYGILISAFLGQDFSEYNIIHHNTLINNNPYGTSQAKDDGIGNIWYDELTKEGNYWSDWNGLGNYKIDGKAENKDKHPLTKPVHETTFNLPKFLKGRAILLSIVVPVSTIVIGIVLYGIVKRYMK